jgi:uncharacterized membrane protein
MQQFYKFITWRFVSLSMFQAPPRPSSGAYNMVVAALLVVVNNMINGLNWPAHD